MSNFEAFPSGNTAENNQDQEQHDKQKQDLMFMLNRSYDQTGYEHPFDRIQHSADDYPLLSQSEIIDSYLEHQEYETVAKFIDQFPEVDLKAVAAKIIEKGQGQHVLNNLDKFRGLTELDLEQFGLQKENQSEHIAA